ncbi:hypothetical protein A0J61_01750 [Choanephora cucurbitarum]|uniref:Uncharacterized protein n=1 Tax=Choanephora cucurbitarum TaxID=101091 RepID=A0A1C7NP21_9FUNG|nr:hypothetical protein A0J61_01750 [Choanephora cucurbitarum]
MAVAQLASTECLEDCVKDKCGLIPYICLRGTNSLEGEVQQNLIRKFGYFGEDPEFTSAILVEYQLRHKFDHLDCLRQATQMADRDEEIQRLDFEKVEKSTMNLSPNSPVYSVDKDLTILKIKDIAFSENWFHSPHQRTKYTIIAAHTSGKKLLFGRLLEDVLETSTKIDPKFDHLAEKQNNSCEGERVFYKTSEHSEKYYGYWKEQKLTGTTRQVHYSTVSLIELPICEKIFASVHLPLTVPSLPSQGNNKSLLTVPIASIEVVVPEISVLKRTAPNHTYLLNCQFLHKVSQCQH